MTTKGPHGDNNETRSWSSPADDATRESADADERQDGAEKREEQKPIFSSPFDCA